MSITKHLTRPILGKAERSVLSVLSLISLIWVLYKLLCPFIILGLSYRVTSLDLLLSLSCAYINIRAFITLRNALQVLALIPAAAALFHLYHQISYLADLFYLF